MKTKFQSKQVWPLIAAIVISELAGIIGAFFTTPSIPTWYASLSKPMLNPPSWLFAPVWTVLYLLMGVAAFLVWEKRIDPWSPQATKDDKRVKVALIVFAVQLVLNTLWSILFFGLHDPFLALIEIVVLWLAILATMVLFHKVSRAAAWLLLPYILWVSFASYLNFELWRLNQNPSPHQVACTMEAKLCPDGSYVGRTGPNCEFSLCP